MVYSSEHPEEHMCVCVCELGWACWGLWKAQCAMRSPPFASAGLGPCADTHKMSSVSNVSKLTSHILSNSEADSSSLAVRDTLESRCGSLLWIFWESLKIWWNLCPQVQEQQPGSKCEHGLVCALLHTGKIRQNSLSQESVYHRRGSRAPVCVPAQSCHQQLLNSTTFWISTHHENPPLIKCSQGSKKFKMRLRPGLVHTTRSILGMKSFLLVSAVERGQGHL